MLKVCVMLLVVWTSIGAKTLWRTGDRLQKTFVLGQLHYWLEYYWEWDDLNRDDVTVFLPMTDALMKSKPHDGSRMFKSREDIREFILQNSVSGRYLQSDLKDGTSLPTLANDTSRLFFQKDHVGSVYVNGGKVVEPDMRTTNGVLHVTDHVNRPQNGGQTIYETLQSWVNQSNMSDFPEILDRLPPEVDAGEIVKHLNSSASKITIFLANDDTTLHKLVNDLKSNNFIGQDVLTMIKSHVVIGQATFILDSEPQQTLPSLFGDIRVFRHGDQLYVQNGLALSKIVLTNRVTSNGVIHVIDRALLPSNDNLLGILRQFTNYTRTAQALLPMTDVTQIDDVTILVPTDDAFSKLVPRMQMQLSTQSAIDNFWRTITLSGSMDLKAMTSSAKVVNKNNETLTVHGIGGDVWVALGRMKLRIVQGDLGFKNGVVHLVDTVAMETDFTLYDAWLFMAGSHSFLASLLDAHHDVIAHLADVTNQYTVFLPSLLALEGAEGDVLQTYLNNTDSGRNFLLDHIINWRWDVTKLSSLQQATFATLSGKSIHIAHRDNDIVITSNYVTSRITLSNVWCANGVLHQIDRVMFAPVRNMVTEMSLRDDAILASKMLETAYPIYRKLSGEAAQQDDRFTLFLPTDPAFAKIPSYMLHKIATYGSMEALENFVSLYIAEEEILLTTQNTTGITNRVINTIIGHVTVEITNTSVSVMAAGPWAVITETIPVTNGVMYIVDGPLGMPYHSVGREMEVNPDLSYFLDLVWPNMDISLLYGDRKVTAFLPSYGRVNKGELAYLRNNPTLAKQVFWRHIKPNVTLEWRHMAPMMIDNDTVPSINWRNMSVKITWKNITCTNGVIHMIEGILHDFSGINTQTDDVTNSTKNDDVRDNAKTGLKNGYKTPSSAQRTFGYTIILFCFVTYFV